MKHPMRFAFILAAPIEAVNYFVFPYPFGIGIPDGATWLQRFMANQWLVIHWTGIQVEKWLEPNGYAGLGNFAMLLCGYFDTFMLILIVMIIIQSFRRLYP
jgi:hypothetical protein